MRILNKVFRSHSLLPQIYSFLYSLNFTSFLFLNPSHQICAAHIFLAVWPSTAALSASQGLYSWRKWTLCEPGLGLHAHLLSPCLHLVWMELVQVICLVSQMLGVHIWSCSDMSQRCCFLAITHHRGPYTIPSFSSKTVSESYRKAM